MDLVLSYGVGTVAIIVVIGMIVLVVIGRMVRKEVRCTAKEWTTVIRNYGTGMPAAWTLRLDSANGEPICGTYKEQRWWWIFPLKAKTGSLEPEMVFSRDWINAFYSLTVRTDTDAVIHID
jgi:hypothetical protein